MTENIHEVKPSTRASAYLVGGVLSLVVGIAGFFFLGWLEGFLGLLGSRLLLMGLVLLGFVGIYASSMADSDVVPQRIARKLAERIRFLQEKGVRASGPVVSLSEFSTVEGISTIEIGVDVGEGKKATLRLKGSAVVLPRKGDTVEILYDPKDLDVAMRVGEEPPENLL